TQERRKAGRTGEPHAHRMLDAEVPQPADPIQDGGSIETELGDDVDLDAGRLGGRDLVHERAIEVLLWDPRMTFRIARDADLVDAAPLQETAVDHFERAAIIAGRTIAVARDDEDALDAGLLGELRQEAVERRRAREQAGRNMRYRAEARRPEPD